MNTKTTLKELIDNFLAKGGKINEYYLRDLRRSGPALVYFHGWVKGENIRLAIIKAMGK